MKKLLAGLLLLTLAAPGWGQSYYTIFGPAAGIQYNTGSTPFDTTATALQIATPFGCSGSQGLSGTGGCLTLSTGSVTSVGLALTNMPCTVSGSPVTTSGTLTCAANTQTANTVWAGPSTGGAVAPTFRALVSADIPPINLASTANGGVLSTSILAGANGGTGNGFFAVSGPATALKTFTFPNASATVLTSNAAVTVAQGGTSLATLTANGVMLGEGTSAPNFVVMGADTVLRGTASADPVATSVNNCGSSTQALSYSTSTHTFGCQTIATSGTPGGSNTQIQYNNSGAFGGASNFTYSSSTGAVAIAAPSAGAIALTTTAVANSFSLAVVAPNTTGQSLGLDVQAGTNASDTAFSITSAAGTSYLQVLGNGAFSFLEKNFGVNILKTGATMDSGTFTGTLTGMSGTTTGTINYTRSGSWVTLYAVSAITGTSNATSFTMTGVPTTLQPANTQNFTNNSTQDNGAQAGVSCGFISGGTVTFQKGVSCAGSGWTASGTKGFGAGTTIATYTLQ